MIKSKSRKESTVPDKRGQLSKALWLYIDALMVGAIKSIYFKNVNIAVKN